MRFHLLDTIDPLNWMMKVIDFCVRKGRRKPEFSILFAVLLQLQAP
jgi:hypothetical protein